MYEERYKRHLQLPEVGEEGQKKISESKVLIVGVGGLGSPVAYYLAAAGVGLIGIIDNDKVDASNLQRQIIHSTKDIGREKVYSAEEKLKAMNPDVEIVSYKKYFDESTARDIVKEYDIVVDATDNSKSKFFINDVCVEMGKPLVHGAINQFTGNVMTILPGTSNYRTIFEEQPTETLPSSTYGVLGVVPGVIGCIQATDVLKYILGIGELLIDQILTFDARTMDFNKYRL